MLFLRLRAQAGLTVLALLAVGTVCRVLPALAGAVLHIWCISLQEESRDVAERKVPPVPSRLHCCCCGYSIPASAPAVVSDSLLRTSFQSTSHSMTVRSW